MKTLAARYLAVLMCVVSCSFFFDGSAAAETTQELWSWGDNLFGQLGDGAGGNRNAPVQVKGLTGVVSVSAGGWAVSHTVALKADCTVWCWGSNCQGQLGDGTTVDRGVPVRARGLTGVAKVAAGGHHSAAIKADGTVWTWGCNQKGQLGDGTRTGRSAPVRVSGIADAAAVAAGGAHTAALTHDGSVWSWGNGYGEVPVKVLGLGRAVAIAAGEVVEAALVSDGTVWIWGDDGRLPERVPGLTDVVAVAACGWHFAALVSDGTVWTWGDNYYGQSGIGAAETYTSPPAQMPGPDGVVAIAAGRDHTVVLTSDGTVWASGDNYFGQVGDKTNEQRRTCVLVAGLTGVVAVSGGLGHTVALKSDGTVWTWGCNASGELGDGEQTCRGTAAAVAGGFGMVTAVAGGYSHTVALKEGGTVYTWGGNSEGQLGDGTFTGRDTPAKANIEGVRAVAAGGDHSVALKEDGTVWSWGSNRYCMLGDGTSLDSNIPVQAAGLSDVARVAAGYNHTAALKKDGTVWVWGRAGYKDKPYYETPVQVVEVSGAIAISCGGGQTVVLRSDGTAWAFGYNFKDGPVRIAGLSGIVAVAAGVGHSLALRADGSVWAWGYNYYGQTGSGRAPASAFNPAPVRVPGLYGVTGITCGDMHSAALRQDGTVWTWGLDNAGQLGDCVASGYSPNPAPAQVKGLYGVTAIAAGGAHTLALRYDDTSPVCAIISPVNRARLGGSYCKVNGTAKDGAGLASVEVAIDGGGWSDADTVDNWGSWNYDWSLPPFGSHIVKVRARDLAGNETLAQATVSVAPAMPGPLTADVPSPAASGGKVAWTAQASGGRGVYEFRFAVLKVGGRWTTVREYGPGDTYEWTPLSPGYYCIRSFVRNAGSASAYDGYTTSGRYVVK